MELVYLWVEDYKNINVTAIVKEKVGY